MGLIQVAAGAVSSVLADQWKEYFYCPSMDADVLVTKGTKRAGSKNKGSDNIITKGSIVVVNEGQCMIIVEQGAIVELSAEPGAFKFDSSTEPTIFEGGLWNGIKESFNTFKKRFTFGGETGNDQRVYYFNTKDIIGNKYGTANPVPFRVIDKNIGLDVDISVKCFGEYSYKLQDPILFYKNICGNVEKEYTRDQIDSQLKSELLTALQPAFAQLSEQGVRYSSVPAHTTEISKLLNQELSETWAGTYGIVISKFGVSSIKASEADEQMIKDLQKSAVLRDPTMAAATLAGAQASAMQAAASNTSTGPMMAFAGMNMATQAGGMNASQLFSMGQQAQQTQQAAPQMQPAGAAGWACGCGQTGNTGKFCSNCGNPRA